MRWSGLAGFKTSALKKGHGGGGKEPIRGESHGPIWGMGDTGVSLVWDRSRSEWAAAVHGGVEGDESRRPWRARLGFWARHSQGTTASRCLASIITSVTDITAVTVMAERCYRGHGWEARLMHVT